MNNVIQSEKANYSLREAAEFLTISRGQLHKLVVAGRIKPFKIGSRSIIPVLELKRFIEAQTSAGDAVDGNLECVL